MQRDRDQKLDEWYVAHAGVVPLEKLLEFGFSRAAVYRMVGRQALIVLQPGVFLCTAYPAGLLQRQIAVCLRYPNAVICFMSAAKLWNFRKLPQDRLLHVLVPHDCAVKIVGAVVHRCRNIAEVDIVERNDGIRLTSPPRTLLDIADSVGDIVATSILEQLINDNRGSFATHVATLTRLGHGRRPGSATMARVITARPKWSRAMQSDLEARVLAEILRQGLPRPEVQFSIVIADGRSIRFDFAWPAHWLALEVDHPFWHDGEQESHSDKWRDRKAGLLGWTALRLSRLEVEGGLREAIADVGVFLRLAGSRPR